jgi:ferredoxin--NADP+ reductase
MILDEKAEGITLPEVQLNLYKPTEPVLVPIVENRIATRAASPHFIRHIVFDVTGTKLEGVVRPGQSIGILADGVDEKGKPHKVRLYSIASPSEGEDGQGRHISTTVKRVVEEHWEDNSLLLGACSNYLCNRKPGDMVRMTGPSGKRFLLPENPAGYKYVFFATGTGIAPFRAMIMDLMHSGVTSDIILVFGCAYRTDYLYDTQFEEYANTHANFKYIKAVSRENLRPDGSKPYVQTTLLDKADILMPVLKQKNTLIYICGMKGMEAGIYQNMALQGLVEYFKPDEELMATDPAKWPWEVFKKGLKTGERLFVEVY